MRDTRNMLARTAFALGLALMLTFALQISSARQQDNSRPIPPPANYNPNANDNRRVGIPYNAACRKRCNRRYRSCLRSDKGRESCRRLHRDCLQRCPQ